MIPKERTAINLAMNILFPNVRLLQNNWTSNINNGCCRKEGIILFSWAPNQSQDFLMCPCFMSQAIPKQTSINYLVLGFNVKYMLPFKMSFTNENGPPRRDGEFVRLLVVMFQLLWHISGNITKSQTLIGFISLLQLSLVNSNHHLLQVENAHNIKILRGCPKFDEPTKVRDCQHIVRPVANRQL
jgi:hypothetical protein